MSLVYNGGVAAGRINLNRFVEIVSTAPAKIFGLFPKMAHERRERGMILLQPAQLMRPEREERSLEPGKQSRTKN